MSAEKFSNPVVRWIDHRLPVFSMLDHEKYDYPVPKNLNYMWNFGVLAGLALVIMIVTGIVLAMNYTAHVDHAFGSVERIMRDVNHGWLIRYIHMNTASFFFIVVYIHMFRGLYYGSYKAPRELLWMLGVVIFLLMMATAFMGYVLHPPTPRRSRQRATLTTQTHALQERPQRGAASAPRAFFNFRPSSCSFFAGNHSKIFAAAGLEVKGYRYWNKKELGLDFKGMLEAKQEGWSSEDGWDFWSGTGNDYWERGGLEGEGSATAIGQQRQGIYGRAAGSRRIGERRD